MAQNERAIDIVLEEANARELQTQFTVYFDTWEDVYNTLSVFKKWRILFQGPFHHHRAEPFYVCVPKGVLVSLIDLSRIMPYLAKLTLYVHYNATMTGHALLSYLEDRNIECKRVEVAGSRAVVVSWTRPQES